MIARTFRSTIAALGCAGLLGFLGCAGSAVEPGPRPARTSLPRGLTAGELQVRDAANAFSFALWHQLDSTRADSTTFVSPLSASFALGMALNGAAGTTLDEMRRALQLGTAPVADIDAGYKSLIALLTSLDPSVAMQIANSIWYRNTFPVNAPFLDAVQSAFGATVAPLDFTDRSASLARINGWVDDNTRHRITRIVDDIPADAMMFLVNAIYFKADWRTKFDPANTADATFHGQAGDHTVALMHRGGDLAYAETPAYQAVDLPYGDSAFTMTVILPAPSTTVAAVAASLSPAAWNTLAASFTPQPVDLALPKMHLEWDASLIPELKALGMRAAFDGADFTPLSPLGRQLVISEVRQKTFVIVDESGTEAAAVTSVGIQLTSAPMRRQMRVDRPFIFVIRERLSGTILFMGKVQNLP